MKIIPRQIQSPVNIHTETQDGYLIDYLPEAEVYINGQSENSKPAPVILSWDVDGCDRYGIRYTVYISTDRNMNSPVTVDTYEKQVEISNLLLSAKYYWKVECTVSNETFTSVTSSFETSDFGPRFIDIDGITNVRDVGGWPLADGGKIRQGLLLRGAAPVCDKRSITEKGLAAVKNVLGIKTEIDLRIESDPGSVSFFGPDIDYKVVPMKEYKLDAAKENVLLFFRILADKTIYPAYMHCHAGSDRTGFLSFLLLALLGADESCWLRDYSSTNLSLCEFPRNRKEVRSYAEGLEAYPGGTLKEKTENYLLSVGVTEEELNTVRDLFTEKNNI